MVLSVIPGHSVSLLGMWPELGPMCRVGRWVQESGGWQVGDGSGPGLWPAASCRGVRDHLQDSLHSTDLFLQEGDRWGKQSPLPYEVMQLGR